MSHLKSLRLVAALAALSCSAAFAADSQNLSVTATVSGTCKLTAVPAMGFTLDPSVGGAGAASSTVQYKCTKGLSAGAFTVGGQANGTTGAGGTLAGTGGNTDTIAYTITWSAPAAFTGTGFGASSTAGSVTLNGAIADTAYQNVAADTYSGTIAVTIAP